MAFLRTKKINGKSYCYLVQNKHTKKGPRQKVKKYLGRAFELEQKKEMDFFGIENPNDYLKKSKKDILNDLIKFELVKHGFRERKDFLVNKGISVDKKNFQILKKTQEERSSSVPQKSAISMGNT